MIVYYQLTHTALSSDIGRYSGSPIETHVYLRRGIDAFQERCLDPPKICHRLSRQYHLQTSGFAPWGIQRIPIEAEMI